MLGIPGFADGPRGQRIFNLRRLDAAMDARLTFTGGGNRQRRRIYGAVGPERTNRQPYSEKLDEASAWSGLPTRTSTPDSYLTGPFWELTKTTNLSSEATSGVQTAIAVNELEHVELIALGGSSTSISVGLLNTGNTWGLNLESSLVIDGPGTLSSRNGALFAVTGLSTTQPTRLLITRRHTTSGNSVCYIYPGSHGSTTVGASVKVTRVHRGPTVNGTSLGPYIKTLASAVSTTDWPRRTLNGNGTTPQYGDGGWWVTDGTADLLPSNVIGPSGYPMSKLARRNTNGDGIYAYQSGLTFIAGEKYARRIVSQAGDEAGDTVFVELATSPGVYIANGTINVRTGAVPAVNNGTIVLVGQIGKQFIFEMRGTAPATVTTGYCSWIIPNGGTAGQGHYFGCDQVEHNEVCTAHMHSGLGQYGSAITPPFGQLVDVDAGKPRIEYGADGFGRGVCVEGATVNLFSSPLPTVVPSSAPGTTVAVLNGVLLGNPGYHVNGAGWGAWLALYTSVGTFTLLEGQPYCVSFLSTKSAPINTYLNDALGYQASTVEPVGGGLYRHYSVQTAGSEMTAFLHVNDIGGHVIGCFMAHTGSGPRRFAIGTAPAEALKFLNMDTLGLNQDAWTIIVEATEPASDPTPGYPMILRMTGPGGVVATINKQPDGQIEFQIYDGATNVAQKLPAGTIGTTRRYLLGFDRASQTMRYAATGAAVADAVNASLATVGPYTAVQIGSADGFWWCNNITSQIETYPYLMSAEEMTRRL